MPRRKKPDNEIIDKVQEKEKIDLLVKEFMARGGSIEKVQFGKGGITNIESEKAQKQVRRIIRRSKKKETKRRHY